MRYDGVSHSSFATETVNVPDVLFDFQSDSNSVKHIMTHIKWVPILDTKYLHILFLPKTNMTNELDCILMVFKNYC